MLQPFFSLPDDELDAVIDAITVWCGRRGFTIGSDEGRRALLLAVDLISSHSISDFRNEIGARLSLEFGDG